MANDNLPAANGRWNEFESELRGKERELATLLPPSIPAERFLNAAIIAVKRNPDLLLCDRRYLFNAVTASAIDGLLPDGREGAIIWQFEKVKIGGKEETIKTARWAPMLFGIRKRARELDSIIVSAAVVCKNDKFKQVEGDNPAIIHEPVALDAPAGPRIGVYAIFKREDGTILHREIMRAEEVEAVRECSKQPNGLMWSKFAGEAWKKSAVRRGSKSVPCSEKLQTIINRFDDIVDIDGAAERHAAAARMVDMADIPAAPAATAAPRAAVKQIETSAEPQAGDVLSEFRLTLQGAKTPDEVDAAWDEHSERLSLAGRKVWDLAQADYEGRLEAVATVDIATTKNKKFDMAAVPNIGGAARQTARVGGKV